MLFKSWNNSAICFITNFLMLKLGKRLSRKINHVHSIISLPTIGPFCRVCYVLFFSRVACRYPPNATVSPLCLVYLPLSATPYFIPSITPMRCHLSHLSHNPKFSPSLRPSLCFRLLILSCFSYCYSLKTTPFSLHPSFTSFSSRTSSFRLRLTQITLRCLPLVQKTSWSR